MKTIKQAKWLYIICSAFICLCGLLIILKPDTSVTVIGCIIGAVLLFWGLSKILGYFSKDTYFLAFQFDLALGIIIMVMGLIMLIFTKRIIEFFPFIIGMFILIDSVFKIQTSLDARMFGLSKWWVILTGAILCGSIGLYLMFDSVGGSRIITVILGLSLLFDGCQNLFNAFYTIKVLRETDISREQDKEDKQ